MFDLKIQSKIECYLLRMTRNSGYLFTIHNMKYGTQLGTYVALQVQILPKKFIENRMTSKYFHMHKWWISWITKWIKNESHWIEVSLIFASIYHLFIVSTDYFNNPKDNLHHAHYTHSCEESKCSTYLKKDVIIE